MATLSLTYGTMAAGKSTLALQLCWQLRGSGQNVALWTFGDRSGQGLVTSRLGISAAAVAVTPDDDLEKLCRELIVDGVRVLVVDEAQFATTDQIDRLAALVDDHGLDVHCFGLGADFRLDVFPGTARLFACADVVRELPLVSYCWCGRRGRCNARVIGGVVQRDGEQRVLGDVGSDPEKSSGEVSYVVLCRRHWRSGEPG
jgi:thymidine kinase